MTREEVKNIVSHVFHFYEENAENCNWTDMNEACGEIIKALEQEPCEDVISRKSIKQKLQEHHDFFVNAYGGFNNLPQNDKSRVDEITNCIAMVVNEPPVTPQEPRKGHWVEHNTPSGECYYDCSRCCCVAPCTEFADSFLWKLSNFCPDCGAKMIEPQESEVLEDENNQV